MNKGYLSMLVILKRKDRTNERNSCKCVHKKDGTHVKEHYRTIDSNNFTVAQSTDNQTSSSTPILTGGVSMDVDLNQTKNLHNSFNLDNIDPIIRQVIKAAANVALPAIPIAFQIYQAAHLSDKNTVNKLMPHLNNAVNSLTDNQKIMKQNLENNLKKLTSTKNQDEYAALYKSFVNENEIYKQNSDAINKIKYATQNKDYEMVVKELDNYMNLQNNIIRNIAANNPINSQPGIERNTPAQYKTNLNSMNFAPYPSPYINSYTQPDVIKINPLRFINDTMNQDRPDAKKFMDMALAFPDAYSRTPEYMIIPKKFNKAVSKHLNVDIPRDWNGVAFEDNSPTSQNLSNSSQLQQQVVSLYRNGKFLSDKIPIELNQDKNLHYSVGHGTIIRPNVDKNGYFKGILFDLYDYDWIKFHFDNWRTAGINNSAFILQQIGLLKNYYILIPIKFKMY